MTRLQLKLADLRRRYDEDCFHVKLRMARAVRIGKSLTGDRGNAWDRVREHEQTLARLLRRYKEEVENCYRNNRIANLRDNKR